MRWERLNYNQKVARMMKRRATWKRRFAFMPRHDPSSQIVYWLEFVWTRSFARDKDNRAPWVHEYRGGSRDAPALKLPPQDAPPTCTAVVCQAHTAGDTTSCARCNLRWDTNDPFRPECKPNLP